MNSSSHQNVENLTVSFDYLHAPSSGNTPALYLTPEDSKRYKPQNPKKTVGGRRGTPEPYVINEDAVNNEEAVRCGSCQKDHPAYGYDYCPYSFSTISKRYKPQNPNYSTGGALCGTQEPSMMNEEPVHCRSCKKDHPAYAYNYCPYMPCTICFKTGHVPWYCPFLCKIPKDAAFDKTNYEISCQCGNPFIVDKWVCTQCPGYPLLKKKFCSICCEFTQHSYYECPKDKVRAALYKSDRDRLFSRPLLVEEEEEEEEEDLSNRLKCNATFIDDN